FRMFAAVDNPHVIADSYLSESKIICQPLTQGMHGIVDTPPEQILRDFDTVQHEITFRQMFDRKLGTPVRLFITSSRQLLVQDMFTFIIGYYCSRCKCISDFLVV